MKLGDIICNFLVMTAGSLVARLIIRKSEEKKNKNDVSIRYGTIDELKEVIRKENEE